RLLLLTFFGDVLNEHQARVDAVALADRRNPREQPPPIAQRFELGRLALERASIRGLERRNIARARHFVHGVAFELRLLEADRAKQLPTISGQVAKFP